jgi:predicted RecB family endonuclease
LTVSVSDLNEIITEEINIAVNEAVKVVVAEKEPQILYWKTMAAEWELAYKKASKQLFIKNFVIKAGIPIALIAGGLAGYYIGHG